MSIFKKGKEKKKKEQIEDAIDLNDFPDEDTPKKAKSSANSRFAFVAYAFLVLFLALIGYFAKVIYFDSDSIINNAYNKRTDVYSQRIVRGDILSSDGEVLATTITDDDGNETRYYPYGKVFSHIVGYTTEGSYGIESSANFYMLRSHTFFFTYLLNEIMGNKNQGDTVITSLDADLQQTAYDALGDYDGAVVVMEPSTGRILAMVSKPSFDPNTLEDDWDEITSEDESSVLINRATQGLYPPGSTFKIFAALEYLRENNYDDSAFSYVCKGSIKGSSTTIHCYHNSVHGELTLKKAFAKSCNSAFASLYDVLDISDYCDFVNASLFGIELPTDLSSSQSSFTLTADSGQDEIMQTLMGQGQTVVTPFHMALIMCALDNGGVLMNPYETDSVVNDARDTVKEFTSVEYGTLFSEKDCDAMLEYMRYTVTDGTASDLDVSSYTAGGKTGTAEFSDSSDSAHAWFVGYAGATGYNDIVVSIILEDSGSGSEYAVPVAKKIFDEYFD